MVAADLVVGGLSAAAAAEDDTQTVVNNQTMFLCLTDDQMSSKAWEAVLSVRCQVDSLSVRSSRSEGVCWYCCICVWLVLKSWFARSRFIR